MPISVFTSGNHQSDTVAGVAVLLSARVCAAVFVPAPDSLGGPEPQHSPPLLQSSCAILATILYLKIASPDLGPSRTFLFFVFLFDVLFAARPLLPRQPG